MEEITHDVQSEKVAYIEIATGANADIFAQDSGWNNYEHHVADSKRDSGYYIVNGLYNTVTFTEEDLQTAEVVTVTVVCNCAESFSSEEMKALKINGRFFVVAQEFEENFL